MKKIIITIIVSAVVAASVTLGICVSYSHENMLDMSKVTDITTTETGVLITTISGDGYYWER